MPEALLRRVQGHLREGTLIVFAGAGVSAPYVPTWQRLTELLFEEADARCTDRAVLAKARDHLAGHRYADALSVLERAMGAPQFRAAVEEALDTEGVEPTDASLAIATLSPQLRAVVTTNLDTLLERAFSGRWPAITRSVGDLGTKRGYIWKLHGTLPEAQTWVMTREQYDRVMFHSPEQRALFATLSGTYHFLFVGFGLTDNDLDASLDQLSAWFGNTTNTHYAFVPAGTVPPSRAQRLQALGITCICYPNADGTHGEVPRLVRSLLDDEPGIPANVESPPEEHVASSPAFVGRRFVFDRVDAFVRSNESGYLFVTGDPGIGKTWFAREFVRRRHAIAHFNSRPDHVSSAGRFLHNICRQLSIRLADPAAAAMPPTHELFADLLERAAGKARTTSLIIVIDALDEADPPAAPETNKLFLPTRLSPGCFVIVTSRRFDDVNPAPRVERSVIFDIADDPRHRDDARTFITQFVADRKDRFHELCAAWHMNDAAFIDQVLERSEANFMYLSMVLPALAEGVLSPRELHDPDALPVSLTEYYWRHWERMKRHPGGTFGDEQRIVCLLAAAREPLAVSVIGVTLGLAAMTIRGVLRKWHQFLRKSRGPGGEPLWSIYHASFQEFLREHVGFEEVERALIERGLAEFDRADSAPPHL